MNNMWQLQMQQLQHLNGATAGPTRTRREEEDADTGAGRARREGPTLRAGNASPGGIATAPPQAARGSASGREERGSANTESGSKYKTGFDPGEGCMMGRLRWEREMQAQLSNFKIVVFLLHHVSCLFINSTMYLFVSQPTRIQSNNNCSE